MKINQRLENIFAHAVALTQSGRLRSTIYCINNKIYIYNQDRTVLLRFILRKTDIQFKTPISFDANDYDSNLVEERNGKIIFIKEGSGWTREKACSVPTASPEDIEALWKGYTPGETNPTTIKKDILSLFDESLSHLEFSGKNGALRIVQRNIYTGSLIKISRKESKGMGLTTVDTVADFSPIGIRTNDFQALFSFVSIWKFFFPSGGVVWGKSLDPLMDGTVLLSKCVFDEMGGTKNGREKSKNGRC